MSSTGSRCKNNQFLECKLFTKIVANCLIRNKFCVKPPDRYWLLQHWLEICWSKLCWLLHIDGFLLIGVLFFSQKIEVFWMLRQLLWMNRSLTVWQLSNSWKIEPRRADYLSDDNLGWSGHPGPFVHGLGTVFGFLMSNWSYLAIFSINPPFWKQQNDKAVKFGKSPIEAFSASPFQSEYHPQTDVSRRGWAVLAGTSRRPDQRAGSAFSSIRFQKSVL